MYLRDTNTNIFTLFFVSLKLIYEQKMKSKTSNQLVYFLYKFNRKFQQAAIESVRSFFISTIHVSFFFQTPTQNYLENQTIEGFFDKYWPDLPFNSRTIHFCEPQGCILTDLGGLRHYYACLTFHQTLLRTTTTSTLLNKINVCIDEVDDTAFLLPKT